MGRAKRDRVVDLTSTKKHIVGRDAKQKLIEKIREHIDKYDNIYIFSTENMRNAKLKELREEWKDSRFFFGRKKVAQVALGRSIQEEYADGLQNVSKRLTGNVGMLFTNRKDKQVRTYFRKYRASEYARSGFIATQDVTLNEGPLEMFVSSQEPTLRALHLPVTLKKGVIILPNNHQICRKGEVLTPENAKLLELLGIQMADFRLVLECHWSKASGFVEVS